MGVGVRLTLGVRRLAFGVGSHVSGVTLRAWVLDVNVMCTDTRTCLAPDADPPLRHPDASGLQEPLARQAPPASGQLSHQDFAHTRAGGKGTAFRNRTS